MVKTRTICLIDDMLDVYGWNKKTFVQEFRCNMMAGIRRSHRRANLDILDQINCSGMFQRNIRKIFEKEAYKLQHASKAMNLSVQQTNLGKFEDWRIWTIRTGGGKKTENKKGAITIPFFILFGSNFKHSSSVTFI